MTTDPVSFLERIVPIDTTEGVSELRTLLVDTLVDAGVEPTVDDAGNVRATRTGDDAGTVRAARTGADLGNARATGGSEESHLVLNTHLDTVPPHLPAGRAGDVVRGRGACDAKGPLAAMLTAFLRADPAGRVTLAVTPDEETVSTGAAALAGLPGGNDLLGADEPLDADFVVVGEPTELDVCTAARGRFQAVVTVEGEAAHAASPSEGTNAIAGAERVLAALDAFDDRPEAPDPHPTLGAPTLTPTVVEGGEATNQVPDECRVVLDRRCVPPETAEGFRERLERHLRAAAPGEVAVRVAPADRETPFLEAFETPADSGVVRTLQSAGAGEVRPFGAATEASYFAGIAPTVVFGPGGLADDEGPVAHADREYVRASEVREAADVLQGTIERLS